MIRSARDSNDCYMQAIIKLREPVSSALVHQELGWVPLFSLPPALPNSSASTPIRSRSLTSSHRMPFGDPDTAIAVLVTHLQHALVI